MQRVPVKNALGGGKDDGRESLQTVCDVCINVSVRCFRLKYFLQLVIVAQERIVHCTKCKIWIQLKGKPGHEKDDCPERTVAVIVSKEKNSMNAAHTF